MAEPATSRKPLTTASNEDTNSDNTTKENHELLKSRQSQELVIGLCGPIGCGIDNVQEQLSQALQEEGYEVVPIRVSKLIEEYFADQLNSPLQFDPRNKADRINALMDAGNSLREQFGGTICADLAISSISSSRQKNEKGKTRSLLDDKADATKVKRAYLINQLKHPEEVEALKRIYGKLFYLIGVLSDKKRREISLEKGEGMEKAQVLALIARDQKEIDGHGQHLEETLFNADFFINNTNPNASITKSQFIRFLKLLHGQFGVTPTTEEYGMFSAYSASLQSACMSRQVGASILDDKGILLAIGKNDVPKFGGGLYTEDDNITPISKDFRCIHKDQQCHNDLHKSKLKEKIAHIIDSAMTEYAEQHEFDLSDFDVDKLAEETVKKTPIKSLIEYSRAIHAEMDAIISLVRKGKSIPNNSTLFTTTFPCHNCARHIVAAGIFKVIYIEPYEKSLALTLHDDAIEIGNSPDKVQMIPFQGVAPSRYQAFFSNTTPMKQNGKMIFTDRDDRLHVDPEFVDSYMERELKIAKGIVKPPPSEEEE